VGSERARSAARVALDWCERVLIRDAFEAILGAWPVSDELTSICGANSSFTAATAESRRWRSVSTEWSRAGSFGGSA